MNRNAIPVRATALGLSLFLSGGPPILASSPPSVDRATPSASHGTEGLEARAPLAERLAQLTELSRGLVEKAKSGQAPAHEFRIEARMYRELLRQVMLQDRKGQQEERIPNDLLLDMVRMSALLHSAADCKTGLVITCPPDLMIQLKSQQAKIDQRFATARPRHE